MTIPPSTLIACPVMYADAGDARYATTDAISAGSACRPSGMKRFTPIFHHLERDAHPLSRAAERAVHHIRISRAGADGVHGNVVRRQLECEHLREPDNGELRRRVAAVLRLRDPPGQRRDVDDAPALALLDQRLRDSLAAVVDAVQVHVDLALPLLVLHLPEVLLTGDKREAGVVDEYVDPSELRDGLFHQLADLLTLCDIDIQ